MAEEASSEKTSVPIQKPLTKGVGPEITTHKSSKRIKSAHRLLRKSQPGLTLKDFVRENSGDEDVKKWLEGKKQAKLPKKEKAFVPKEDKPDKKKGKKK